MPPNRARWVLSLKAYLAAILALYVSFKLGFERPSWALITIYVLMQPLSGAIRSKAALRFGGTLVGVTAGLFFASLFVSAPGMQLVVLVCWCCLCGYRGTVDRTPRYYFYLLAGYTAVVVSLPGLVDPTRIFQTALSRSLEIGLGLVAVLLVDSVVFPRSAAPVLAAEVERWLADARRWTLGALSPDPARRAGSAADRQGLAAGAGKLDTLAEAVRREIDPDLRRMADTVALLRERALLLLPTLSAIDDGVRDLLETGGIPGHLLRFHDDFQAWVDRGAPSEEAEAVLRHLEETQAPSLAWRSLVEESLAAALRTLVLLWSDCRRLQRQLAEPHSEGDEALRIPAVETGPSRHVDRGLALWSALAAGASFFAVCGLWAAVRWPNGSSAALIALLWPLFLGRLDDPTPALVRMARWLAVGALFGGFYTYAVLAHADSYVTFAMALALVLLPLGLLLGDRTMSLPVIIVLMQLNFTNGVVGDFATYLNSAVASVVGVTIGAAVISIVRAISAETSARRILRAGWADLAAIAASPRGANLRSFLARMLDRIGLLVPRLSAVEPGNDLAAVDALADLRTGIHLIRLEQERPSLDAGTNAAIDRLLAGIADHFRALRGRFVPPPRTLLEAIDEALVRTAEGERRPALHALVGIRRGLFPDVRSPPVALGGRRP